MVTNEKKLLEMLMARAKELAGDCQKVYVAVSGGIDSSLVAAILCRTFGDKNVVALHRQVRSNPRHLEDVKILNQKFRFKLIVINADPLYDEFLRQAEEQFKKNDLPWFYEGEEDARIYGFENAYASLKSRMATFMSGFIAKAVDGGKGRIFGTGNGEEDGLLRYFDKYGDGAVDNNILDGLTKAEVRQLARYVGIPLMIVKKTPSADLLGSGDLHNDEGELSKWAQELGFDIRLSYGSPDGSSEGNIAWAWKQDIKLGVISGETASLDKSKLKELFSYTEAEIQVIEFLRIMERKTRHKVEAIPGLSRAKLLQEEVVD